MAKLAWVGVLLIAGCGTADPPAVSSSSAPLSAVSVRGATTFPAAKVASGDGSTATEIRPEAETVDEKVPRTGLGGVARVPADHVPKPAANTLAAGPGATGFLGLTHRDQRLAGGGNQFSLEPPDQALCVGNGYVLEGVNTALAVYDRSGSRLGGPVAVNDFFGLAPEIIRSTPPVFGDFTSDPKCLYDSATGRFFVSILQIDVDAATGDFTGRSHVLLAVSQSGNPLGGWTLYSIDTTNDGQDGTASHPGCPCFGDQPLIGADANGFYVTTNEFPLFQNGFNGAQIYALGKAALVAGHAPAIVHVNGASQLPLAEGIAYSVQPATTPPGAAFATDAGGTEYFMSALEFTGGLDDRVAVWALTGTGSLADAHPALKLSSAVLDSEVYGMPPSAQQANGPLPLADAIRAAGLGNEKLELIDSGDDRMNASMYVGGKVYAALTTVLQPPNGPTRSGISWFVVQPSIGAAGTVSGSVVDQGYVSLNQTSLYYPTFAVNAAGVGAIGFSMSSPTMFPSSGFARFDGTGITEVHIDAAGVLPEDGFTGYVAEGGNRVSRWGDYSAAAVDGDGSIWLANEYIPNAPRTVLANWGTYVAHVLP